MAKPSRLRILLVCAVNGHGGPIQSVRTLVRHADPARFQFVLATQALDDGTGEDLCALVDRVIPMDRPRGWKLLRAQFSLIAEFRHLRRSVDVIHANGLTEAVVVLPVSFMTRLPVVVWVHNFTRPRPYVLAERVLRRLLRRWTFIAVSKLAASQVRVVEARVVPNPVDRVSRASRRSKPSVVTVSYLAGSDRPYKGFDLLPDIISSSKHPSLRWRIYSSPPFTTQDPSTQRAWRWLTSDARSNVELHSRVSDVQSVYDETDIVLCPSRSESFNRVVAEAMANGIPVVASDLGPHRDLLLPDSGLIFPLHDCRLAATLIDTLASDEGLYESLSGAALVRSSDFETSMVIGAVTDAWRSARRSSGR